MAEPAICNDCTVFIADENSLQGMGDTVNHCPMHAAAGDMLAALEWIERDAAKAGGVWARRIARKASAAARSGAPRPDVLGDAGLTDEEIADATMRTEGARDTLPRGGA